MGQACLPQQRVKQIQWLPSLRPGQDDWSGLLQSLGKLYGVGVKVDWQGFERGYAHRRVPLPTYPFQRQRHWIAEQSSAQSPPDLFQDLNKHAGSQNGSEHRGLTNIPSWVGR